MAGTPPIIIKKKVSHGGHHGGAWKVAYADFVTAMMALFIVLWLMNTSKPIQEAVSGYFKDPKGTEGKKGGSMTGKAEKMVISTDNMDKLKQELEKAISGLPNFKELSTQVEMTITNEGLRIELLESAHGTFFDSGSAKFKPANEDLVIKLAEELGKL